MHRLHGLDQGGAALVGACGHHVEMALHRGAVMVGLHVAADWREWQRGHFAGGLVTHHEGAGKGDDKHGRGSKS
jgi:hypothetical protein